MRISDWSSDVCSSDLAPAHAAGAVPAGLHRLRKADGRQQLPGRADRQAEGEGIDLGAAVGHPQGAAAELRPGGGELRRTDRAGRRARRTGARLGWQAGRSEEHTSELQSLMRTSYAVF